MDSFPTEGLHDPSDFIGRWVDLHPSSRFYGELARLALARLRDDRFLDVVSIDTLRFDELGESVAVQICSIVEEYEGRGRVFHVLVIRSEGDPWPLEG